MLADVTIGGWRSVMRKRRLRETISTMHPRHTTVIATRMASAPQ
ncbi:Protein of unknown function [Propionibacterium freudenreichii]|nr:Protein of unknown function [Propionibacterium freudenreichii]